MRTNFYEEIHNFYEELKPELDIMMTLDYESLITQAVKDVPVILQEWFSTIIRCRFRVLILFQDIDRVIEEELRNVACMY